MDKLEIELFCIAATAGIRFDDAVRMKRLLGYLSTTSQYNYDQVRKNYLRGLYVHDWEWQHYEIGGDVLEKIRYIMGNDPILYIEWF